MYEILNGGDEVCLELQRGQEIIVNKYKQEYKERKLVIGVQKKLG